MSTKCPKCGQEITREDSQCPQCGVLLKWVKKSEQKRQDGEKEADRTEADVRFCPDCGGKLGAGQKFCPECGTPVAGRKAGPPPVRAAGYATDTRKYDEAVRMGQEVEEWGHLNDMGPGCLDPIAFVGGPPVAGVVFFCGAYFWHELWYFFGAIVVLWLVAACCRMAVRVRLGERDTEGARRALQYARVFSVLTLLAVGAAMVDFWCHLESCAEKYDRKVEEAADGLKRGLDGAARRLQR